MTDQIRLQMSLDLPRDSARITQTRHALAAALSGVAEDCRADILLALTEACANVINHAELATLYHIDVAVDAERCVIEVTDDGGGFDPSDLPVPQDLDDSGRGLHIVAAVVDGLDVVSVTGAGTHLRFTKLLTWA